MGPFLWDIACSVVVLVQETVRSWKWRVCLAGKMKEEIYLATSTTLPAKRSDDGGSLIHEFVLGGVAD